LAWRRCRAAGAAAADAADPADAAHVADAAGSAVGMKISVVDRLRVCAGRLTTLIFVR
jgi:hypothetical protein